MHFLVLFLTPWFCMTRKSPCPCMWKYPERSHKHLSLPDSTVYIYIRFSSSHPNSGFWSFIVDDEYRLEVTGQNMCGCSPFIMCGHWSNWSVEISHMLVYQFVNILGQRYSADEWENPVDKIHKMNKTHLFESEFLCVFKLP